MEDKVKLAIGLRVYEKNREALVKKMRFLDHVPWHMVGKVFVAVNVEKDQSGALEYFNTVLEDSRVEAFPVQPWFKIGLPALNAIVHKATAQSFTHLWFVSTRLVINGAIAETLLRYFVDNPAENMRAKISVVGAVMPGHQFSEREWKVGISETEVFSITGETTPFNTCAVWSLRYLHPIGFLPISEMPTNQEAAGIEELPTILMQGKLFGACARMLFISDIRQQTAHWDEDRKERNTTIILTKAKRSKEQVELLSSPSRPLGNFVEYFHFPSLV